LVGRGVRGEELQGPGALSYLVGVVLWSLRVGEETGLVGLAGKVVKYCGKIVVIGTVNHGYACVDLARVDVDAIVLRQIVEVHQCGSRKGEDSVP
jgi:hypothetical protein